jgi:hypothetical protein
MSETSFHLLYEIALARQLTAAASCGRPEQEPQGERRARPTTLDGRPVELL